MTCATQAPFSTGKPLLPNRHRRPPSNREPRSHRHRSRQNPSLPRGSRSLGIAPLRSPRPGCSPLPARQRPNRKHRSARHKPRCQGNPNQPARSRPPPLRPLLKSRGPKRPRPRAPRPRPPLRPIRHRQNDHRFPFRSAQRNSCSIRMTSSEPAASCGESLRYRPWIVASVWPWAAP